MMFAKSKIDSFPKIQKIIWASDSRGDMSHKELSDFYVKLGGTITKKCDLDGRAEFALDLDKLRKQKFFDFKKISDFIRSGGSITIKKDGDQKPVKSKL